MKIYRGATYTIPGGKLAHAVSNEKYPHQIVLCLFLMSSHPTTGRRRPRPEFLPPEWHSLLEQDYSPLETQLSPDAFKSPFLCWKYFQYLPPPSARPARTRTEIGNVALVIITHSQQHLFILLMSSVYFIDIKLNIIIAMFCPLCRAISRTLCLLNGSQW